MSNAPRLESQIKALGREPRKCYEYEQGAADARASRPPRADWPVAGALSHLRYQLGYLEGAR